MKENESEIDELAAKENDPKKNEVQARGLKATPSTTVPRDEEPNTTVPRDDV
jgi:hypothetical protein